MIRLELGASADPLRVGVELGPGAVAGGKISERDEICKIRSGSNLLERANSGAGKHCGEMFRESRSRPAINPQFEQAFAGYSWSKRPGHSATRKSSGKFAAGHTWGA
jgi:hypothetical protein